MATVTGVTAERAQQIEDRLITGALKQGSSLILQTQGGAVFNITNAFVAAYETTPVGGILMTVDSRNPSTYMGGGTWVRWGQGRVPVSQNGNDTEFNTVEKVGGEKAVTLSKAQMPSHNHGTDGGSNTGTESVWHTHSGTTEATGDHQHSYDHITTKNNISGQGGLSVADSSSTPVNTGGAGAHAHNFGTGNQSVLHTHPLTSQGGDQSHNNIQPYIVCYMWKRTA